MDDSIYRLRQPDVLALCVLSLLLLGVVMVQSASMNVSGEVRWAWTQRGFWHLVYATVAVVAFYIVGNIDYARFARRTGTFWRHPALWGLLIAIGACVIVLVPGIGIEVNGARRWLPMGLFQVQPSELAKWGLVVFLAWWLANPPVPLESFFKGLIPTCVPIGIVCLLIVVQDFGTAALIGLCSMTMLLASRIKLWHLAMTIPPALGAAFWFVYSEPYRWKRMTSFLDPWASPQGEGFHMIQSLLSFATGGVVGRGLGNGIQKLGYLPEDTTDFIFAVICEELGLCGALLVICLYLGIMMVAWQLMKQKRDDFGRLLAFGIASMVGLQALINIAVATVSVPTKGLSLPLISAGGSGLVITCAALGLLYSVTRFEHPEQKSERDAPQPEVTENLWRELTTE